MLRGINVSGQKKIIMSELRELLEKAEFSKVETYIQSGNILLQVNDNYDQYKIEEKVGGAILGNYGYSVEVFAMEPSWLNMVVKANPFLNVEGVETRQLALTFISEEPGKDNIERLDKFNVSPDEYIISGKVIYIRYINGAGKSKLTNNLIEAKLKVKATGRNWNTTLKLLTFDQ